MTAALLSTVLVTSLAGSLHCLAMCGPLVGLAGGAHSVRLGVTHALGRLVTYATLGVLAGLVGSAVDLAGRFGHVQHAATILAAIVIVGWGLHAIAIAKGWLAPRRAEGKALGRGLVALRRRRPGVRAYLAGMLTGLVPCGWLWAFVVASAGTGNPLGGGAVMAVFWLGTVPVMTGLLVVAGPAIDRLRRRVPVVTSIALIVLGLGTLATRWGDAGVRVVEQPACHHEGEP